MWLGYRNLDRDMYFNITKEYQEYVVEHRKEGLSYKKVNGVVMGRLASACWFTNFDIAKRHEPHTLHRKYCGNEAEYPKYDNYDAIEVVNGIPKNTFPRILIRRRQANGN